MEREEIADKVKDILSELLSIEKDDIVEDSNFVSDLHADSLDSVEIIMEVEDKFNISIEDNKAEMVFNVKSLIDLIENKLEKE